MKALTAGEIWAAVLAVSAAQTLIFGGWALHLRSVVKDILREEKHRLRLDAARQADLLAHKRVREILSSLRVEVGVQLVNESDTNWGEERSSRIRKEDSAA